MNTKKIITGVACVLATMVAAQSAQAQFLTRAEREMITQAFASQSKEVKAPAKEQKQEKKEVKKNTSANTRIPGREMNIVYSSDFMVDTACKIGQKCWEGICSVGQACANALQQAATNTAKYGPGGRESAIMRSGEAFWNVVSSDGKTIQKQVKENSDSLAKALEKADVKARRKASNK